MAVDPLPADVEQFVVECIPSVVHLEALLLMRAHPNEAVSLDTLQSELYVSAPRAVQVIAELVARRLVAAVSARGPFRYAPASERSDVIEHVADVYRTRLVQLSRFIHERAQSRALDDFANAFRLRKG